MIATHRGRQWVTAFVAAVTCYLLAAVIARPGGVGEVVVFGFGAAFGLEFLWSTWPLLWTPGNTRRIE